MDHSDKMVNATECSTTSTSSCEAYSKENKENCDQSKVASNGPVEIIDIDEDSREEADAKRNLSFPDKKHGKFASLQYKYIRMAIGTNQSFL